MFIRVALFQHRMKILSAVPPDGWRGVTAEQPPAPAGRESHQAPMRGHQSEILILVRGKVYLFFNHSNIQFIEFIKKRISFTPPHNIRLICCFLE